MMVQQDNIYQYKIAQKRNDAALILLSRAIIPFAV